MRQPLHPNFILPIRTGIEAAILSLYLLAYAQFLQLLINRGDFYIQLISEMIVAVWACQHNLFDTEFLKALIQSPKNGIGLRFQTKLQHRLSAAIIEGRNPCLFKDGKKLLQCLRIIGRKITARKKYGLCPFCLPMVFKEIIFLLQQNPAVAPLL